MNKSLLLAGGASLLALAFPAAFQRASEAPPPEAPVEAAPALVEVASPAAAPGRSVRLQADGRGHFNAEARLNGRRETVLVDTGATFVAVNESAARRFGLSVSTADFRHRADTANGPIHVAMGRLDRVEIGLVSARNVEVMIARDEALSVTLLGMSFLNKLRRFEVEDGVLHLVE
ncbi:retropepsin-like aspartic protease family protein [Aureimonas populi]|uniref:TIGR02281 family clan AA aspartic protease n=1 Tax=Aureimonas populi TaxID=1701758 RepID=A0ABW5CKT3_9HYPH|nr:TIGR02281 family clan AA aspartic protease [Aureimonas populi]